MSRRRLPAPPLVLQRVFARVRVDSSRAPRLLELARFLLDRSLLTDGGELSLASGLEGRGGAMSLTLQDVRGSAHGLTLELHGESDSSLWPGLAEAYYARYDRGKPRNPTRLQRLFLEWSHDAGWQGMLAACQANPHLWESTRAALPSSEASTLESRLLAIALQVRESRDWRILARAFEENDTERSALLTLLPYLETPELGARLSWLAALAQDPRWAATRPTWAEAAILACRRPGGDPPLEMPIPLIGLALELLEGSWGEVNPILLGALRTYRWPVASLARLRASVSETDPVRRILFGSRPGRVWWDELFSTMELNARLR